MNEAVTVAILAGGQSSRMGRDKSFVLLNARPMIEHVVRQVSALELPILVITNDREHYQGLNLPLFSDILPNKGALGGIFTALTRSQSEATLCVACDMPYLNPVLLRHLLAVSSGYDAVVPRVDGRPQGLHAVYHQRCLPLMRHAIEQDRLKISDFLREIPVRFVEDAELRGFDPLLRSFVNLNTPQDLRQAEAGEQV